MNINMNCHSDTFHCPAQACPNYNATICYEQITENGPRSSTNYSCPSINLCIATDCYALQDIMTPGFLNLTGDNKFDIGCKKGDDISVPLKQVSIVGSGSSMKGDTLAVLFAVGISLMLCGSISI